jgi:anti-sigma B factor antagonist
MSAVVGLTFARIGFMTIKSFQERNINGVTILTVEQGLKGALESLLKDRIDDLVQEERLQIIVDLKQVPYIDSSDIGRIIRAHLSVRRAGGRVRLCNLSEKVLAVLKLTRLDTILDLYQNEEEALAGILHDKTEPREAVAEEST